uniref:Uncharacterized protein n=1 Tax=Poecilia reticulata TaxID=8081 RepID=A0A3P9MS27_POERE
MAALGFIPANDHDAFSFGTEQTSTNKSSKISGEEVKRFYEDLIKDDKSQKDQSVRATHRNNRDRGSDRRMRRRVRRSERAQELQGLRLLRCAHQGDIPGLKELISKGVDINFQDSYLWTAVMCASWSGQKAAVRLLLMHGAAWVGVVDTRGKDAQDLASEGIFICLCQPVGVHDILISQLNKLRTTSTFVTLVSALCICCRICSNLHT